jgi:TolA-binding protein
MSRKRISRLFASSLMTVALTALVPVAFGATGKDIEHILNSSHDQLQREVEQRSAERSRQMQEQIRQTQEESRQRMKDMEAQMQRDQKQREEDMAKERLAAREKALEEEASARAKVAGTPTETPHDQATAH